MSLDLLKKRFGYSVSKNKKDTDNKEKINEKLNNKFNSNGLENIKSNVKSLNSQNLKDSLKERFGHNDIQNLESFKFQDDPLDLLKERFDNSVKKEPDNKEKINEKLNDKFNDIQNLKSFKSQHQNELKEKDRIIENLKQELESQWLTNKVALNTKKMYEDKIKTMEIVDSTKLIPVLIETSRKKQGNRKLDWKTWLEIPENLYLLQINESVARKVFEDTNDLIDKNTRYALRGRRPIAGDAPANYFMSFTGNDEHNQLGRNDTARVDMVATQFTHNDPTNKGFDEGSGRKPLAESGYTISYWWNPYESYSDSFPIGLKISGTGYTNRFEFGIDDARRPWFAQGGDASIIRNIKWRTMFDTSGNGHLSGSLLDDGAGGAPGSGEKLILNKWYHIVHTYVGTDGGADGDGNYLRKIYLNGYHIYGGFGEAKQSHNWTNYLGKQQSRGLSFGLRAVRANGTDENGLPNTKYNNGQACGLDEVAIFSEAKDAAWVSSVYNGGTNFNHTGASNILFPKENPSLVAYWRFNEGSGTTVKDLGPYGWHGTLTNAAHGDAMDGSADNSSQIEGINARFPDALPTWNEIDESVKTLRDL